MVSKSQNDPRRTATVALTTDTLDEKNPALPSLIDAGKSFCTASIIAENALLTAAHCIQKFDQQTVKKLSGNMFPKDSDYIAFFGTKVTRSGKWIRAKRVISHPDWLPELTMPPKLPTFPPNDIGIIILSENIPTGYNAIEITSENLKIKSEPVYLAGFGITETLNNNDSGTLRTVKSDVENEFPNVKLIRIGSFWPNVLNDHGPCAGDSGSPAYVRQGLEWFIAGVASYGASVANSQFTLCISAFSNYTDVRYYADWIKQELAK